MEQIEALVEVHNFLSQHHIPHYVIGGIANAVWGRPRTTHDADFKLILKDHSTEDIVALIGEQFEFRVQDPTAFVEQTFVIPISASNETPVDLVIGFLPYEEQAADNAKIVEYQGEQFPVCTAEDLIIHKAISERERDWDDIEGVVLRQGGTLDQAYILHWLEAFAQALERPELPQRFERLWKEIADSNDESE